MRRILFVCGKNQWRSPTAEKIYRNDPRMQVRSAGLSPKSTRKLQAEDLEWADIVLVMEYKHLSRIRDRMRGMRLPRMLSLNIPDQYQFMDQDLIRLLNERVEEFWRSEIDVE